MNGAFPFSAVRSVRVGTLSKPIRCWTEYTFRGAGVEGQPHRGLTSPSLLLSRCSCPSLIEQCFCVLGTAGSLWKVKCKISILVLKKIKICTYKGSSKNYDKLYLGFMFLYQNKHLLT